MRTVRGFIVAFLVLSSVAGLAEQSGPDRDASWNAFIAWFRAAPMAGSPLEGYAGKLRQDGMADADVRNHIARLMTQLGERSDWIGLYYDKLFGRPLTGNPANDGFSTDPSALVVESISGLKPGAALDVGMGQGRNAVYLAQQGWAVTGFDISAKAVAATVANAGKAGVRVDALQAGYDDFDFGSNRWDLIVMTFAWAPVTDPAFVARLRASLRPGGRVVLEHFVDTGGHPAAGIIKALKPNELRRCFAGFQIASYEETTDVGDWGGPDSSLVRMVAVAPTDLSGTWSGETTLSRGKDAFTLVLDRDEESYSGTISDEVGLVQQAPLLDVRFANGSLTFAFTASLSSRDLRIEVTLRLEAGRLVGLWTAESGDTGPFDFERKR
jgi:2-polyprenyl-3-methyl-5-hydroxy-6-metoxy-1,4-benzoquinol methylase